MKPIGLDRSHSLNLAPYIGYVFLLTAMGWTIANGTTLSIAAFGIVIASFFLVTYLWQHPSVAFVEVPLSLLVLSTFVFRARDAEALASNPLDLAGMYRVVAVGLALLIAVVALLQGVRKTPRPFTLYMLYTVSAVIAVSLSVNPSLTAYRVVELLAGILVLWNIWSRYGVRGVRRIGQLLFGFHVTLTVVVWIEAILFPSLALLPTPGTLIPYRLQSFLPAMSANTVGFIGAVLALWSLTKLTNGVSRTWTVRAFVVLGLATVVASQYRTGYVIVFVGLLVIAWVHRSRVIPMLSLCAVLFVLLVSPALLNAVTQQGESIILRGQTTEVVTTFTGRTLWWDAAIPVWQESPIFGKGLLTGTRFEVLNQIGFSDTSTIHNAWIEALVGTGILGVLLLAMATLSVLVRSWRFRDEDVAPLVLTLCLLLRTVTGSSFEIFGLGALLFGWLCLSVPKVQRKDGLTATRSGN